MDENYRLFFNIKLPEPAVEEEEIIEKRKRREGEEGEEYGDEEFEEFLEKESPKETKEAMEGTVEELEIKEEEEGSNAKFLEEGLTCEILAGVVSAGALGTQTGSIAAVASQIANGGAFVPHAKSSSEEYSEEPEQEQKSLDIEMFLQSLRRIGLEQEIKEDDEDLEERETGLLLFPKAEVCEHCFETLC